MSWDVIVDRVRAAAAKARPGEWIFGFGWHQKDWKVKPSPNIEGFPLHKTLSAASPRNPVLLDHSSGHAAFVNDMAMKLAGIDHSTNAEMGRILKDARGEPTGMLLEGAQDLVMPAVEESKQHRSEAELELELNHQIDLAVEECLSKGITSFQDAGSSPKQIEALKK